MSDWSDVCDAVMADLLDNVANLADAVPHMYAPWSPDELYTAQGERHIAIWPVAESAEARAEMWNDAHELHQNYSVLVWEDASSSQGRMTQDVDADMEFLQLHNDVRARFYVTHNQTMGRSELVWYQGSTFEQGSGTMRWFRIVFNVSRIQPFS